MVKCLPDLRAEFCTRLLLWYDRNKRKLPWRSNPQPYHVWLSEIMLQQTRVSAVIAYYERFLNELPTIQALAEAREDQYLKLWEGLGYYSRVRNLHKAAIQICEEYEGELPKTFDLLQKISGIGFYTAAAIASICFKQAVPAIDGNLLRIFSRLTMYDATIKDQKAKKTAFSYFSELISKDRPGDFNQALMDLGSAICIPKGAPLCDSCPVMEFCASHRNGCISDYPIAEKKMQRKKEKKTVFLLLNDNCFLLRKRTESGLLAGLYEFPNTEGHLEEREVREYVEEKGFSIYAIEKLKPAKHIFSHVEWDMIGFLLEISPKQDLLREESDAYAKEPMFWASKKEMEELYSIPSAFQAYKDVLQKKRTLEEKQS